MPDWMEKYRNKICNPAGNIIEELMNDRESNIAINPIKTELCIVV